MSIDQKIDKFFEPVANTFESIVFYSVPVVEDQSLKLVLVWLAFAAIFFTLYLGFINLRYFGHSVRLLFGKAREKSPEGEINQFQALMASLSGTVGLGNIGGVAVAISLGGPGALFWMTVMGILGMSSKFAEVMLGVKYRQKIESEQGVKISGGPMYFLKEGMRRLSPFWASFVFAVFFAVFALIGFKVYEAFIYEPYRSQLCDANGRCRFSLPMIFYLIYGFVAFLASLGILSLLRFFFSSRRVEDHPGVLVGGFFAGLFALLCVFGAIGGGNMYQANQAFEQVLAATGGDASVLKGYGWAFGLVLAVLVALVILGGLKSIAGVASKLVPLMAGLYLIMGLIVIGLYIDQVPAAFVTIFNMAFSIEAGIGALLGGLLHGIQRAAFSNEAGLGSASIVQSTTNTDGPVGTGMVAMLGPFIDTIIICNITGLVIVLTGVYTSVDGIAGVGMTSLAFEQVFPAFKYALAVIVLLFAYSTMISWYYCGAVCFRYLFGQKEKVETIFKVFFCACIVVGASSQLTNLIKFADAAMLSMAIPNILGLYLFAPEIKRDVKAYVRKLKAEN